jgi:hypothetical protein
VKGKTMNVARGNTRRARAVTHFRKWRDEDLPFSITNAKAFEITQGTVGAKGDETPINLSTVALRYVIESDKQK